MTKGNVSKSGKWVSNLGKGRNLLFFIGSRPVKRPTISYRMGERTHALRSSGLNIKLIIDLDLLMKENPHNVV
jgi:hypothetical protein